MSLKMPFFTLAVVSICWLAGSAQQGKNNRLTEFFRTHFDSTIVYNSGSPWRVGPEYRIISKKDSDIHFFTYRNPYAWTSERKVAKALAEKFMQELVLFGSTLPDTNRYFLPIYIERQDRIQAWALLNTLQVWQLQEVEDTAQNCEDISDGGTDTFYLIANGIVKVVNYYAPEFYEQECGRQNNHRQHAIQAKKVLRILLP